MTELSENYYTTTIGDQETAIHTHRKEQEDNVPIIATHDAPKSTENKVIENKSATRSNNHIEDFGSAQETSENLDKSKRVKNSPEGPIMPSALLHF